MNTHKMKSGDISLEDRSHQFFSETAAELQWSVQDVAAVTGQILAIFRASLQQKQSHWWLANLPGLLQLHFICKEFQSDTTIPHHLDMLVEQVYRADQSRFHAEIQALHAVITILAQLDRSIQFLSFPGISFSLAQEVRLVLMEDAA